MESNNTNTGPSVADLETARELAYSRLELCNSIAWFAMDACWLLSRPRGAVAWAAIAGVFGLAATAFVRRNTTAVLVQIVMLLWLAMNAAWMSSDLFKSAMALRWAKGCLVLSVILLVILGFQAIRNPENQRTLMREFRRFRGVSCD